jgi:hypothetical protein
MPKRTSVSFAIGIALCFASASTLHATSYSVSGQYWSSADSTLNDSSNQNVPAAGSAVYSTTPDAIFTVTGSNPTQLFNFDDDGNSLSNYYVGDFLNYGSGGGSIYTITWDTGAGHAADYLDDTLFQFQGTTTLTDQTIYTFQHDDGFILYLNGNVVVNDGGPSAPTVTDFCVGDISYCNAYTYSAAPGTYSFTLDYAEVDGPGATLVTDLPLTGPVPNGVTPEPGSFIMLGSGMAAIAAALRRRLFN